MRICVIGLGYVGAVTAACLARDGHTVTGIDLDPAKLELLSAGKAPIIEDGIDEVMEEAIGSGRLRVSGEIDKEVAEYDLIFVCVGTPSAANGSQDLRAVQRVAQQIGTAMRGASGFPVVVLRSTVYPGSTESVVQPILEEHAAGKAGQDFGLCFQPEFLREGSSVSDFYNPPFTIVGSTCDRSVRRVRELFGEFPCDFIATGIAEAEMLKLACNAFHALKISFANEIGRLGRALDVDAREVMDLVCRDRRLNIAPAYLKPGFAFGGSCLPKDLRAVLYLARKNDVELPMLTGVEQTNRIHIEQAVKLVMDGRSRKVGLVGLSFKPGTDDLRESPLVALAELLIGKGFELRIYDPAVNTARLLGSNKRFIDETIPHLESLLCAGLEEVFAHAETLIVGQKHAGLNELLGTSTLVRIVDLVGIDGQIDEKKQYQGVCW